MKPLSILIVEDEPALGGLLRDRLSQSGHRVSWVDSGEQALSALERDGGELVLLDLGLPGMGGLEVLQALRRSGRPVEIVLMTAHATLESAVAAARAEALDFLVKPFDFAALEAALRRAGRRHEDRRRQLALTHLVERGAFFPEVIAESAAMRRALALVDRAAGSDIPVLLQGETGTGKDLLARTLHLRSRRAREPFLAINCASVTESLLESELFGHEKGAFTGATALQRGHFEVADGGTLFLDEVGEMPLETQSALLRVLEGGEIRRVGGSESITVDVRVVAATNRDLEAEVASTRFRKDLFFRLNALTVQVPPLRERREDIPRLAGYFLERMAVRAPRRFSQAALGRLLEYAWPGNVRELRNVVERLLLLASGEEIAEADLPEEIRRPGQRAPAGDQTLEALARSHIAWVLSRSGGNKTEAARRLGITKATLYRKLKEYGIRVTRRVEG